MKRFKLVLLASASLALSACSSYDCNSDDVHKTLLQLIAGSTTGAENQVDGMLGGGTTTSSQEAFAKGTFAGVVTLDKNEDTGYYLCKAKISVEVLDAKVVTHEVTYEVKKVESDDADFEVAADQSDINRLRWSVNGPINRAAEAKHKQEQTEAAKAAWAANPAIALSDADAVVAIKERLSSDSGLFDESRLTVVAVDVNSDGYKEFVAFWNVAQPPGEEWRLRQFYQMGDQPGQQTKLAPYDLSGPFYKKSFKHYVIDGNKLTVSDGAGWEYTLDLLNPDVNFLAPKPTSPGVPAHVAGTLSTASSSPTTQTAGSDAAGCEDAWLQAHRAEVGEEAAVSVEQMGEWAEWCKEGRSPPAA